MAQQITYLTPSQTKHAIREAILRNIPVLLHGEPGVGKTEIIGQVAREISYGFSDSLRAPELDPTVDISGFPFPVNGELRFTLPTWWPVIQAQDAGFVLFIDEITRGSSMVQNALMRLIHEGRAGMHTLDSRVCIVSACNDSGVGVTKLSDALNNRFQHIYIRSDVEEWRIWAGQNGASPILLAFLGMKSDFLHQHDSKEAAYPTPRAWMLVNKILDSTAPPAVRMAMIAGIVGSDAAHEYIAFERLFPERPDISVILANPKGAPVSENPSVLYATVSMLQGEANAKNFDAIDTYLRRLPREYRFFGMSGIARQSPDLQYTNTFTKWSIERANLIN